MNLLIISVIIFLLWYFLGRSKKDQKTTFSDNKIQKVNSEKPKQEIEPLYHRAEVQYDKFDEQCSLFYREIEVPYFWERKTYLFGKMKGKYNGEYLPNQHDLPIYNINIYEAEIFLVPVKDCPCINQLKEVCIGLHRHEEGDFQITAEKVIFDNAQLPKQYLLISPDTAEKHMVEIQNINFYNVNYIRKMHQIENKEIFGTIHCDIKGYLSEIIADKKILREYRPYQPLQTEKTNSIYQPILDEKQNMPIQRKSTFVPIIKNNSFPFENPKIEYANHSNSSNKTIIGKEGNGNTNHPGHPESKDIVINRKTVQENNKFLQQFQSNDLGIGCLIPLVILGIVFLIIPGLSVLIPIIGFIILFVIIPIRVWEFIFKGFGILIGVFYLVGLIWVLTKNFQPIINIPKILVTDNTLKEIPRPKLEESITSNGQDTIMRYSKDWKDYNGTEFSGKYYAYKSEYNASKRIKNDLSNSPDANNYNFVIHKIKEFDQEKLKGLYSMFDSISIEKKLNEIQFADMVISFVQDYNYSLILPEQCNPQLYSDNFIKSYLNRKDANCVANEPFGLMTPLEVLVTSKADCDSRTLLIYTILSKYNYDLVVLSSDIYGHSLIGINLPYNGRNYYSFENQKYALTETTVRSSPPAFISNEIANMNNWYISLKSK